MAAGRFARWLAAACTKWRGTALLMWQITTRQDCIAIMVLGLTLVAIGLYVFSLVEEVRLGLGTLGIVALGACLVAISLAKLLEIRRLETKIDDRPELILTFSRNKLEWVLVGIAALAASFFCYTPRFMGMTHPIMPGLMAWIGALLALLGIAMPLFFLLRPRRLILSPQGLDYSLFRVRPIPWRDIKSAEQGEGLKASLIYLQLAQSRPPLVIKCHQLGNLPPVILNAIKLRLKAFGVRRPTEKA